MEQRKKRKLRNALIGLGIASAMIGAGIWFFRKHSVDLNTMFDSLQKETPEFT